MLPATTLKQHFSEGSVVASADLATFDADIPAATATLCIAMPQLWPLYAGPTAEQLQRYP